MQQRRVGSRCVAQDEGESKFMQTHDSRKGDTCYFFSIEDAGQDGEFILKHSAATIFIFAKALPTGAGYFLHAVGAAGGGNAAPDVVAAAAAKKKPPPQVDPKKLVGIWATGTRH